MRYLSLCSGIEAASVAWKPLGWEPVLFSEIEAFPRAVLEQRFGARDLRYTGSGGALWGDMTALRPRHFKRFNIPTPDLIVAGTPCQAFSLAGLRKGLADDRGNLTLQFVRIVDAIDNLRRHRGEPQLIGVWENVPGVFSIADNAFGCFLAALAGSDAPLIPPGRGRWTDSGVVVGPKRAIAWRCLDAQFFQLAQRRKRVFVVFGPRDWPVARALFPFAEGVCRDPAPRRAPGQRVARPIAACPRGGSGYRNDADTADNLIAQPVDLVPALTGSGRGVQRAGESRGQDPLVLADPITAHEGQTYTHEGATFRPHNLVFGGNRTGGALDVATAVRAKGGTGHGDFESETFVVQNATRGKDQNGLGVAEDVSYTLDGASQHAVAVNLRGREGGANPELCDVASLRAASGGSVEQTPTINTVKQPAIFQTSQSGVRQVDTHPTLDANNGSRRHNGVQQDMLIRRLTPVECARLQGFPDTYLTGITWRGHCPPADGPMYRALGNSMAVPVIRWLGEQIDRVHRAIPRGK